MNFKRAVRVEFEGANVDPVIDLRVAFNISASDGQKLNKGIITIYNMRPSSRSALLIAREKDDIADEPVIKVRLFAGYEDNLKQLISGDILFSKSTKSGADWITEIEIWSGLTEATKATVVESWEGRTSAKSIIDKLLAPLNLSINYTAKALEILSGKTYVDFSESGMSMIVAKRFLRRFDLEFTINKDGQGVVGKTGEAENPDEAQTVNNIFNINNGLIGSPIINRIGVDFLSLLRPEINLLQKVFVQSRTINETLQKDEDLTNEYIVRDIRHFGDTHEDEWFTEISATYADLLR